MSSLSTVLILAGGLLWLTAYALILAAGARDRTYGMPIPALLLNIAWEGVFSFVYIPSNLQRPINLAWLALDVALLLQVLRWRHREFPAVRPAVFSAALGSGLLAASAGLVALARLVGPLLTSFYGALGGNLVMSILFLRMLKVRGSDQGQSLSAAVCRLLGTPFVYLGYLLITPEVREAYPLGVITAAIFALDVRYLLLLRTVRSRPDARRGETAQITS